MSSTRPAEQRQFTDSLTCVVHTQLTVYRHSLTCTVHVPLSRDSSRTESNMRGTRPTGRTDEHAAVVAADTELVDERVSLTGAGVRHAEG